MRHAPARAATAARYTVLERRGGSARGAVHRAVEHGADGAHRVVALKRLSPALDEDGRFGEAFAGRAAAAAELDHPGIARIHRIERGGTGWLLASELVRGPDLDTLLARCRRAGRRPPRAVGLAVLEQLRAALAYLHGRRRLHGNLSASNVLVDAAGRVVLTDAGMAGLRPTDPEVPDGDAARALARELVDGAPASPGSACASAAELGDWVNAVCTVGLSPLSHVAAYPPVDGGVDAPTRQEMAGDDGSR
jgi:serine/threonine-protein kinase